jgi:hypothetical protein
VTSEHCFLLDLSYTEANHVRKRHALVTLNFKEKSDAKHAWKWVKVQNPIHAMQLIGPLMLWFKTFYEILHCCTNPTILLHAVVETILHNHTHAHQRETS